MLTVERFPTAASFLAGVEPFLLQAEVENNLILGIAHGLASLPPSESPPAWFAAVRDPAVQGCAFSSVPEKLGLTRCTSREAVTALARDAAVACPRVTHIIGPEPTVAAFAEDFGTQLGRAVRREMAQRIHSLSVVEPPAPRPPGQLRLAQQADLPLVIDWVGAFMADVGETAGNPEAVAADRIAAGLLYLWDHAGPVSMAGVSGRTPHGVRIALVYTPPQQRGRGYASACVGGLSQRMLESGFRFCCLYTDLANPTSNAIYHRLGYRPVCDSAMYLVEEPAFDRSA